MMEGTDRITPARSMIRCIFLVIRWQAILLYVICLVIWISENQGGTFRCIRFNGICTFEVCDCQLVDAMADFHFLRLQGGGCQRTVDYPEDEQPLGPVTFQKEGYLSFLFTRVGIDQCAKYQLCKSGDVCLKRLAFYFRAERALFLRHYQRDRRIRGQSGDKGSGVCHRLLRRKIRP